MAVISKAHVLAVVRRVYGERHAEGMAGHLPDRIDLEDPAHTEVLFRLGLTPDRLFDSLGAEL